MINDVVRFMIARSILLLGVVVRITFWLRIITFRLNQRRLKQRYQIDETTPPLSFGPEIEALIDAAGRRAKASFHALTSGSTGNPKKLLYTKRRLRQTKVVFVEMFAQACLALKLRNTSLYVFSSFESDDSLSSLLLEETRLPNYFAGLQAPYRIQKHPQVQELVQQYGPTAVRLWLLTIANPAVLYATNPSTLATFFDELKANWEDSKRLAVDWTENSSHFHRELHKIARRIDSTGSLQRLLQVSASNEALKIEDYAPRMNTYICWTGGYVRPFLERLDIHLPWPRYQRIPMYSMSTETIETVPYFTHRTPKFLPLARGVFYEFADQNGNILSANELQQDQTYTMIVSDGYGLRRYKTEDQFLCLGHVRGLPDLHFVGRATSEYSFTGEKLTSRQVDLVFQHLRQQCSIPESMFLSCLPSTSPVPHYKVVLIGPDCPPDRPVMEQLCDQLLQNVNREYANKRQTGRLGPITVETIPANEFAHRVSPTWETQFKFLPFYSRLL
jgi:hypothetical protein